MKRKDEAILGTHRNNSTLQQYPTKQAEKLRAGWGEQRKNLWSN